MILSFRSITCIQTATRVESCNRAYFCFSGLLFLFVVDRVLLQTRAKLFQFQFLSARFSADGVVVITGFFANQEHHFGFFLAFTFFGHDRALIFVFCWYLIVKVEFFKKAEIVSNRQGSANPLNLLVTKNICRQNALIILTFIGLTAFA